jgi:hypothetical protein
MARLEKTADLIGAKRCFLVSQTRNPVGDAMRASYDLSGLLKRIQRA